MISRSPFRQINILTAEFVCDKQKQPLGKFLSNEGQRGVEGPLFGSGKHISTTRRSEIQLQNMVTAAGPFPIPVINSFQMLTPQTINVVCNSLWSHFMVYVLAYGNWLGEGTQLAEASRLKFESSNWLMVCSPGNPLNYVCSLERLTQESL